MRLRTRRPVVVCALLVFLGLPLVACPPGVTDLVCTEVPEGHLLTWTNNDDGSYTFLEIVRNDESIATLPADATSFLDESPPPDPVLYIVFAHDGAAPTGAACAYGEPGLAMVSEDATVASGATIDVPIHMDSSFDTIGFSFGYEHDPAKVTFMGAALGSTLAALHNGAGPDFVTIEEVGGSPSGFIMGCIYDLLGNAGLPAGEDYELVVATYAVDAAAPDTTELEFNAGMGNPPVANVVVLEGAVVLVPVTDGSTLTIVEPGGGNFIRGDVNDDGVIGLPDVMVSLQAMFLGGELDCHAAADANADGSLQLDDALLCLNYLYQGGEAPAAPFPNCGSDPQNMGCDQYLSCP